MCFFDYCHLAVTIYQSRQLTRWSAQLDDCVVGLELDVVVAVVGTCSSVKPELDFGLETGVYPVPSANHVQTADGWVVADLLPIDGTTVNYALVGFAEDGVEGFVHADVVEGETKSEADNELHPVDGVGLGGSFFKEGGSEQVTFC
jgi:hypothetical protein